jgi:DNA repair protein RecO (recombination protein O)
VTRSAGQPWADRLLPLPAFLTEAATPTADAVADGLALTGFFLTRDVLADHPARARLQAARAEVVARLTAAPPK